MRVGNTGIKERVKQVGKELGVGDNCPGLMLSNTHLSFDKPNLHFPHRETGPRDGK